MTKRLTYEREQEIRNRDVSLPCYTCSGDEHISELLAEIDELRAEVSNRDYQDSYYEDRLSYLDHITADRDKLKTNNATLLNTIHQMNAELTTANLALDEAYKLLREPWSY